MKIIKYIFTAVFVMTFVTTVSAQNLTKTATTAAQFLKIAVGPKAIGMGGAFTATADDASAIYYNPAGIASNYSSEVMFNHTDWLADTGFDFAGVSSYIPGLGTVGAFVSVLSMDEMLVRTVEMPEGTGEYFDYSGMTMGITFARNLTDKFSIGFNAKYINETLWHESASAFAVDIGTMYKIDVLNEFRLAASISNFGTKMKMDGRDIIELKKVSGDGGNMLNTSLEMQEFDLPLMFRAGVAADVVKTDLTRLTVAIDAVHPNDHYEHVNTGAEFAWNDLIFFRGGLKSLFVPDSEESFTFGAGLKYMLLGTVRVKVDYAYQDWGRLNNVHNIALGVKF